jgi:hypothetical protein
MTRYTRNQDRFKPLAVDTPQMRAAINLVIATKDGQVPDMESLNVLADAFLKVFGGVNPQTIFGGTLGLVPTPGGQADYGFTPADVVSAVIELERRRLGGRRGALAAAKRHACKVFVDIAGPAAMRSVERDWSAGRRTVESLSDADLQAIIKPYEH